MLNVFVNILFVDAGALLLAVSSQEVVHIILGDKQETVGKQFNGVIFQGDLLEDVVLVQQNIADLLASAEEVQNAINNQGDDKLELMSKMNRLVVDTDTNEEDLLTYYGVESNNQMSVAQLKDSIKKLEKKAKGMK